MSRGTHWRQPAKKRAGVLLAIATAVGGLLGFFNHFEDYEARYSGLSDAEREARWQGVKAVGRALQGQEWRLYDRLHYNGKKARIDPDIVVLGIDDGSLDLENSSALPEDIAKSPALQLMSKWPWSREVYAHVLDRLIAAGARTVVIDLLFPAESSVWPEGDAKFKAALDRHKGKVIIGADWVFSNSGGYSSASLVLPWEGFIPEGWPADERIGTVTFWADPNDGVIRQARFLHSETGEPERALPSFAGAVARAQGRADLIPLHQPQHTIRFSDPNAYKPYPVHEIFIDDFWKSNFANGEFFKGKTVFLGPAARQMQDAKETPVGTILGVQVHAHALASLKGGLFLKVAGLWPRIALLAALVFGAAALVYFWRQPLGCMLVLGVVTVLALAGQLVCFNELSAVLPMFVPLIGWNLTGFIGLTHEYLVVRKQKEAFRRRINQYFSPDMAAEILRDPDDYYKALAGANRTITILFSDVRGFTSMSESAPPSELVTQLNEYLERMVEIVYAHRGSIDKFIGDAVMAVWGRLRDPSGEQTLNEEALAAVTAAVRMREELVKLNTGWKERGMQELAFGIGIHQGEAIVGDIGSSTRKEFTAIGDTVNSASRLESATKQYGTDLIISDAVRARIQEQFVCRTADMVKVKGKLVPMEIFTVPGRVGECDLAALEIFEEAVRLFRGGIFDEALAAFEKARAAGLDDGLTAMYVERCQEMIANPPENWDGVWTMTKK